MAQEKVYDILNLEEDWEALKAEIDFLKDDAAKDAYLRSFILTRGRS